MDQEPIRLTTTVQKSGCAAKLPAGQLQKVLNGLNLFRPQELKVGIEHLDDGCLWDMGDGQYLIQTLDFFTPIVDDPRDFGAIAAANALSDVYAMGGEPKIALTILCYPTARLPLKMLQPMMLGAIEKITEAGACLAGGHSIDDETLKLGFSVSGFVDTHQAWTNQGARPGDVLVLTKGLGTGTLTTALKLGELPNDLIQSTIASMTLLNRTRDLLGDVLVHAATDITGFGLAGHAMQMAQASRCSFEFEISKIPSLPGAVALLADGYLNRAHQTNREYVSSRVVYDGVEDPMMHLTVDAQTSGGLLLALPVVEGVRAVEQLKTRFPLATVIGQVVEANPDYVLKFEKS